MTTKNKRVSLSILKNKSTITKTTKSTSETSTKVMPPGLRNLLARRSINKGFIAASSASRIKLHPSRRWISECNGNNLNQSAPSQHVKLIDETISYPMINSERSLKCDLPHILPLTHCTFKKEEKHLPAITTILKDTMPALAAYQLQKWRKSMIKKLGEEGFTQFQNETFSRGKKLHSMVEHFFLGKEPPQECSEELAANLWNSIESVLKGRVSNVRLVEHTVTHNQMGYRGIVDAVAFFDNKLTVIDFKTTVKQKVSDTSLYDSPLQVSAYCGALNHDPEFTNDILGGNVTCGALIYAYTDGSPATIHYFDEEKLLRYWSEWCTRLAQYQKFQIYKESLPPQTSSKRP